jgi:hypothetical protein
MFVLQYGDDRKSNHFVIARLSSPAQKGVPVVIRLDGTIDLKSRQDTSSGDPTQQEVCLAANDVLVGIGTIAIDA